jgi:hypothetical protein
MKEGWNKLASIDCSDHIEKKGNLSYLSWAWAWKTLCDNFPDSTFEFEKAEDGSEFWPMPDGTGEVRCSLTVAGLTRTCWLPVMDYKNSAITGPNARDVNDAKMRCLVKCIALFGLGLYIYAGEDIPTRKTQTQSEVVDSLHHLRRSLVPVSKKPVVELPLGGKVPIGNWEGILLSDLTQAQLETLWEHRDKFADYPDMTSYLQNWRKA